MKNIRTPFLLLALAALVFGAAPARAQWTSETYTLKNGWNAIFLHVDCAHATMATLTASQTQVQEVWYWMPSPTVAQFVTTPDAPSSSAGSPWLVWKRTDPTNSKLTTMPGNGAYLVKVSADCAWTLKGKPVLPRPQWTSTGINLIGYPMAPGGATSFDAFFAQAPDIRQALQAFYYNGGDIAANPLELFSFMFWGKTVKRGEAYWLRAGDLYNRAYGPFEISMTGSSGIEFSDITSQRSFRLKNLYPATNTITMRLLASETPPSGQPAITAVPPLLVRGAQTVTDLSYGSIALSANQFVSWTLPPAGQPGSEAEVVVGINRYAMAGAAGDLQAGLLRFTDSFGFSQIDAPLSAQVMSTAGLWIGNANVTTVNSYLKTYAHNPDGTITQDASGKYVSTSLNTSPGAVKRAFPLRLILHNSAGNSANLLGRVFYGLNAATNPIVALRQASLDPKQLGVARRISAAQLPWSAANTPFALAGQFRQGGTLTGTIALGYADQASNPFLHTYHPDHDNMDALFASAQPQGYESYGVTRRVTMNVTPPDADFGSLTTSGQTISGAYAEEITIAGRGSETRVFNVSGTFKLNRISPIAVLTP